jgi:hypothetical protein
MPTPSDKVATPSFDKALETQPISGYKGSLPDVSIEVYPNEYSQKIVAYHELEAYVNSLELKTKEMERLGSPGAGKARRAYELMESARQDNWRTFSPEEQEFYYRYRRFNGR